MALIRYLQLEYVPVNSDSLHVYLNGIEQYEDTDWILDEYSRVKTLVPMDVLVGDLVEARYAHRFEAPEPYAWTSPTVVGEPWFRQTGSNNVECWWRMEGMEGADVENLLGAAFYDLSNGHEGSTFGNLSDGPRLAGGSYADNIYYGNLTRPWYDTIPVAGLQVSYPWNTTIIYDYPDPVTVQTTAPPTSYQG